MSERRGKRFGIVVLLAIGILPFELNGWYNPRLPVQAFWLVEVFTWIVMPLAIFTIALHSHLMTADEIGLHWKVRDAPSFVLPLLLIAVPFLLYHTDRWTVAEALKWFPDNPGAVEFSYKNRVPPPGPQTGFLRLLALVHLSVTAGFVEEIYYRGMMDRLFPRGLIGGAAYVIVSSLIFASVHWENGICGLIEAFSFGLLATIFFRATRNIWPLIVAHVVIDFLWFS